MKRFKYLLFILALVNVSCSEYTPKPKGYFRIDLPQVEYLVLPLNDLPYSFEISPLVEVELPPVDEAVSWINLSYPSMNAKIYCSYIPITPKDLDEVMDESRLLVMRQAKDARAINEQMYTNPDKHVYGSFFQLDGESASPIQFVLTDSVSHFFRGSLLYNCTLNPDSLNPVTDYLKDDILELIESFSWK